jgi:cytochrome b6-f complex iron-sulfur subunit
MTSNAGVDRRTFLAATIAACACATCPLAGLAKDAAPAGPVDVGTAADYPRDGAVYDVFAKSHGFFLVRDGGSLYALSATCTHKKTLLKAKGKALACPKHGARFKLTGAVAKGPARRPLGRFAITADDAGRITVDPSQTDGGSVRLGDEKDD